LAVCWQYLALLAIGKHPFDRPEKEVRQGTKNSTRQGKSKSKLGI